jgi:hypothetical protein
MSELYRVPTLSESSRLKFQDGNAKIPFGIKTFSLRAGYSCPGADKCRSKAVEEPDGSMHIEDGPNTEHRCFMASGEARLKQVYEAHYYNESLLLQCKTKARMARLIKESMPKFVGAMRLHASGDFFSQTYFDAWLEAIRAFPHTHFYGYTKSLPFWVKRLAEIPDNLLLTASQGGRHDWMIEAFHLRHAIVVYHPEEAARLGLEIDHDDSIAYTRGVDSFANLLHGTAPKGSKHSAALKRMRDEGISYGYTSK